MEGARGRGSEGATERRREEAKDEKMRSGEKENRRKEVSSRK